MHRKMYLIALALYLLTWRSAVAYEPLNLSDMKADSGPVPTSPIVLPLTGNVYPNGYYTVNISIGNDDPPKTYVLDVDTGSYLTWARCSDDHKRSVVKCGDDACKALGDLRYVSNCTSPNDQCQYFIDYANRNSSAGILVRDSIRLTLTNGTIVAPQLIFGCDTHGENTDQIHGMLGLGKGELGILKQLNKTGVITRNVVSHCLSGQGEAGGYLYLGNLPNFKDASWVQTSSDDTTHYNLGSADILFDGQITYTRDFNITFDSGRTFTYLSRSSYHALLEMVRKNLNNLKGEPLVEIDNPDFPICWREVPDIRIKTISDVTSYFINVTLNFTNNVQFEMYPESYLIVNDQHNVCLGIFDGTEYGLEDADVIGDISMQNKMMMYDNDYGSLGWADVETCMRQ